MEFVFTFLFLWFLYGVVHILIEKTPYDGWVNDYAEFLHDNGTGSENFKEDTE